MRKIVMQKLAPDVKMTNISMEWTDTGALINSSMPMCCPVCKVEIPANVEHRCGEFALPGKPARKRRARS